MLQLTLTFIAILVYLDNAFAGLPSVCPEIVSKDRWGGRTAIQIQYSIIPVPFVIIHHTVTSKCDDEDSCTKIVKSIQDYHMNRLDFDDIGYNFLVGGDGRIYEGAGWHIFGAHTLRYNSRSIGLGFIGDFSNELPNEIQLKAAKDFLKCADELGEIEVDYKLLGGKQVISTDSPGLKLYREIQNWKHYSKET